MNPIRNVDYENLSGLNKPFWEQYREKFAALLEKGWFILGEEVQAFEKEFGMYLQSPHFLGVASGLDAMEIPIKALDFPAGSEIIVPSNTYIATINAVINTGHKPVFAEPIPETYNIDPARIAEKITSKTKAILIVHLYGKPCDMDPIVALCEKHNLVLIEDCAQSHGAAYKGKMTGTFGIGAFSFYPTKNLGAMGDAGGISVANESLFLKLKAWRNYGSNIKYKNEFIGDNSRLDEIQAAFLRIKLQALDAITAHKRKLADIYFSELSDQYILPKKEEGIFDVFHIFAIRHPKRDALKQYLLDHGIKTEIHYPIAPCHQQSIRDTFDKNGWELNVGDFEQAIKIHETILSLPVSTIHTEEDIRYVVKVLNAFEG